MARYIGRRLLQIIPTLLGVFTIVFILTDLMPSDPLRAMLGEQYRQLSPQAAENFRQQLGLNDPFMVRYIRLLGQVIQGNLGRSYILDQNVSDIIAYRFPRTLELMAGALITAIMIGLPVGLLGAHYVNSWFDHFLTLATLTIVSIPIFWLAVIAQLLLTQATSGVALLPVAGYEEGNFAYLILPSLLLGMSLAAGIARITRAALLEVQTQDYITVAKAKGLPFYLVVWRHQLRNALMPILTVIALDISSLMTGSIIIETVFNWPGLGRALVPAIERQDTPVITGILLFGAFLFIVVNLLTDVLYTIIDPRIRYT